ncbi:MAG: DNA alkylation repair protein [Pseudomonadota bacterium]
MKITAQEIQDALRKLGDKTRAEHASRFFKTGKGEYGEGDKFLGIRVPVIRSQVKKYKGILLDEIMLLLRSAFHEERLFALLMLVEMFSKGNEQKKKKVYKLYLDNTIYINNWDLVDLSAGYVVGAYLADKDKSPLYKMARSKNLWERRISIISTLYMIRRNDFEDALAISAILKNDGADLIHKAVGWMLREIGKRDLTVEKDFLNKNYKDMPRTMLRYAIERFPEKERKLYLKGEI